MIFLNHVNREKEVCLCKAMNQHRMDQGTNKQKRTLFKLRFVVGYKPAMKGPRGYIPQPPPMPLLRPFIPMDPRLPPP